MTPQQFSWAFAIALWAIVIAFVGFHCIRDYHRSKKQIPIGSKWILRSKSDDPWPKEQKCVITVRDCKDGWVRYSMGGEIFNDERTKTSTFLHCYREAA